MIDNISTIISPVCDLVLETGSFIRNESVGFDISRAKSKGLHDFVSYVDLEAEKMLTAGLAKILPGAGFLTEEGTASGEGEKYTWIIDPLDGTTNFLHGLPTYSISIALREDQKIVLGVVYVVTSDEMFHATLGGGAWLNGTRIGVSRAKSITDGLIATGFPYRNFTRLPGFMKCLEYFIRNCHGVRRMGSAAVDLAYVACGRFDAFYEYNLNPWDVSAGILLVREAGGRVSDFSGIENEISGLETIAANGLMFEEFKKIVGNFMAE